MQLNPQIVERASVYKGNGRHLESALGCYVFGTLYGWRVLYMVNSQKHLRDMRAVLDLDFKEVCPERTSLSHRSLGLRCADRLGSFWSVIRGSGARSPVPDRMMLSGEPVDAQ